VRRPGSRGRSVAAALGCFDAAGQSFGWINRDFIRAGKTGTQFDNYGGEDRFWLGPEGGQLGLYFAPSAPFTFGFYEIETSSPGAELAPGQSRVHTHRTFHLVGEAAALEPLAKKMLGVALADVAPR
jgi:hypothetical protein